MSRPLAVVVLAAGQGKRTKVNTPKVLLPLCGRTLLGTVLDAVAELQPERTIVVVGHQKEKVEAYVAARPGVTTVDQGTPKGTGHAVQVAAEALKGFDGDVMVTYGDAALITADTLRELRASRGDAAMSLLTAVPPDPSGLGRVLRDETGLVAAIREERDCSDAELEVDEINAGFYCFDGTRMHDALASLTDDNAQKEYYITDTVTFFLGRGEAVCAIQTEDASEIAAVNSLSELAVARSIMQLRILEQHMASGVIIDDPYTTYIDHGVTIGAGTRILPCTVIHAGVVIGEECEVGPFSQLRVGAVLEDHAEVGNFVEMKKSRLGRGSKAKHLTYLGDATIGAKANIGAGTITANYDGVGKYPTTIDDGAFIGSGTVLVAPSHVGKNATTGAGAIVTRNTEVGEDEIYVGMPAKLLKKKEATGR